MRPGIRRLVAAAFGVLGSATAGFAQGIPVPAAPPGLTPPPPLFVPDPLPTAAPVPVRVATPEVAAPVASVAPTGVTRTGFVARAWNATTIGEGCANPVGCGTWASERTFLFGSCCQFFNPGNKCGPGLLFGKGLGGRCASPAIGTGGLGNHNSCCYGSYLNR